MIIIGLGTGRCGTASLAKLLSAQRDSLCFHELNPSAVRFFGTPRPMINTINEFQDILDGGDPSMLTVDLSRRVSARAYDSLCQMRQPRLLGDVAFYYLNYVETIARHNRNVRFICLRRDREETIRSWMNKTTINRWLSKKVADHVSSLIMRERYLVSSNFWMEHDGSVWQADPVWDKCFPKFKANAKSQAIGMYWDYYYERAEQLRGTLGDAFRIIETKQLDTPAGQTATLEYCGIPASEHVATNAHIHRSAA